MRKTIFPLACSGFLGIALLCSACNFSTASNTGDGGNNQPPAEITLPSPSLMSSCSLEKAIFERVSRRSFSSKALNLQQVGQLLWAAQGKSIDGVTGATRTAPSAGATYPVEIYLVAGKVEGLEPGVYRYNWAEHSLRKIASADRRKKLADAALRQHFIAEAPASIVLAAEYRRTTSRYGERGIRYVHMEVGHITQNIYLQCVSLNLGTVAVGAFHDEKVKELLEINEEPLMILPVGETSSPRFSG